jgi:hypothetical protein
MSDYGPDQLLERWRAEAEVLRRRGGGPLAEVLEGCRAEVEAWWQERRLLELTPEEAARYSGYTTDGLRRGNARNVGTKGSPRYRLGELPRKARSLNRPRLDGGPDLAEKILESRGRP